MTLMVGLSMIIMNGMANGKIKKWQRKNPIFEKCSLTSREKFESLKNAV